MDTQRPGPGGDRSEESWSTGASSNMALLSTQQERSRQLVHRDAANKATQNMTQDTHLKIICKTGSSKYKRQHDVGCESIHTVVNGRQSTISHTAGVRRELRDQFLAACNWIPQWSTNVCVCTVGEVERDDVVC